MKPENDFLRNDNEVMPGQGLGRNKQGLTNLMELILLVRTQAIIANGELEPSELKVALQELIEVTDRIYKDYAE